MLKWASSLVGAGGPALCCVIKDGGADGEAKQVGPGGTWLLLEGEQKEDKSAVSVFKLTARPGESQVLEAGRNAVKRIKTLRHPNVLKFLDSAEEEGRGGDVSLYIVTEKVTPLSETLAEIQEDKYRDAYLAMGLQQIAKAVSFLNNDATIVHGCVCVDAVAVTETLDWKLFGFDFLCEFSDGKGGNIPLLPNGGLIPVQYKPLEAANGDWTAVRQGPVWGIDGWGLGCLIQEIFSFKKLVRTEDLRRMDDIPKQLVSDYQRLLSNAPTRRLNPSKLLENSFFSGQLQDIVLFLENLSLKDSDEKDAFFRKLARFVDEIPANVAQRKVLPLVLRALEYGGAPPSALAPLLKIGKQLNEEDFGRKVLPSVTRLFGSTDRAIRISLLQNIGEFEPYFTTKIVNDQLFSNISSGFTDATPFLRELTLKSMIPLVPKLNTRNLNSELLKHLAKLQVDQEGSIRANTTICLGKIAPNLSEAARKRVLMNAFTRALKDQFPAARCAGLMAMIATCQYYEPAEMAFRAMPSISVLMVDQDGDVRKNAFKCAESLVKRLKENSDKLAEQAASVAAAKAQGPGGNEPKKSGSTSGGDMMSWAVGSISNRLSSISTEESGKPSSSSMPTQPKVIVKAQQSKGASANSGPRQSTSSSSFSREGRLEMEPAASTGSDGGWDDDGGSFDAFDAPESTPGGMADEGNGWGDLDDLDTDDAEGWGDLDESINTKPTGGGTGTGGGEHVQPPPPVVPAAAAVARTSAHVQLPKPRMVSGASKKAKPKPMKLGAVRKSQGDTSQD